MEKLPTSTTSQQLTPASQIKVCGDQNSGIREAIQYVIALLGTPKDKQPSVLEMTLIINYLKTYKKDFPVDEIRQAYDLAIQGSFVSELNTYGGTLSMKNIISVLNAYLAYKKDLLKKLAPKEDGMNNIERLKAIVPMLAPEVKEHLKSIGTPRPYVPPQTEKPPFYDVHQKWFRWFDALYNNSKFAATHDFEGKQIYGRFIKRYGEIMNVEGFFNKKVEQLILAKNRNSPPSGELNKKI